MEGAQLPGDATSADIRPRVFAGFPVSSWAFALRVLLAMLLALYVSFWLELESPRPPAITVQSLRLPTLGRGMEKPAYRRPETAMGGTQRTPIAGTFSQTARLCPQGWDTWVGSAV